MHVSSELIQTIKPAALARGSCALFEALRMSGDCLDDFAQGGRQGGRRCHHAPPSRVASVRDRLKKNDPARALAVSLV